MHKNRIILCLCCVCAFALTGCGAENKRMTENVSRTSISEAAEETKTIPETETTTVTAAETTAEVPEKTEPDTETAFETTAGTKSPNPYKPDFIEFSDTDAEDFSGKFYECTFDSLIVAKNEESFIEKGGTREMIESARQAVLEGDEFKNAAAEIKADTNGIYKRILSNERVIDEKGNLTAAFAEGFSGDFAGDGKEEVFAKTILPVYAEDSPNAGKLSVVFLWSVNSRNITLIDWSGYQLCENKFFTVQVGDNRLLCIVYKLDAEKEYQYVGCFTFFNGMPRNIYGRGGNIVTDMTDLYLKEYGEEGKVKPVSEICSDWEDNAYLE